MLIPVVLSGGAGTRLWPVSREGYPKPFMKLADGESLLMKTYRRALNVADGGELLTVTNRDYFFMSKDEMALLDTENAAFLLEPFGRNTAPAMALAAKMVAERHGRDAIMLVLPADHLIQDQNAFNAAVAHAKNLAAAGKLVTFGIVPTAPETGFGYIEIGAECGAGYEASRFVEKPSLEKAREYIESRRFLWNSGMFCFRAGVLLDEMASHASELSNAVITCWDAMSSNASSNEMLEIPSKLFSQVPDISIDYAVMERSEKVVVIPADIGWSDIGSWVAVRDLSEPDLSGNRATSDDAIFINSKNTYVRSDERVVAAVGVRDLLIIDTPDALLVADPSCNQDVKKVVANLKKKGHQAYKLHRTVNRPWGSYTTLGEGGRFKIKRIEVKPGASLSLQMHHHRSEHWIVVSGMAKVTNGEREFFVRANESTYIPAGCQHRLENPGVLDLVMIEVQSGDYLGEDDIVRFQDVYGRT